MSETNNDLKVENLEVAGEIELPKLDVKAYIGKRAIVDRVEVFKSDKYGYYVEIETVPIDHIGQEGNKKPLTIKRRLFLVENRDTGAIGWTKDNAMGKLLASYKVDHYNKLKGVEVIVQTEVKDGKEWLTF